MSLSILTRDSFFLSYFPEFLSVGSLLNTSGYIYFLFPWKTSSWTNICTALRITEFQKDKRFLFPMQTSMGVVGNLNNYLTGNISSY